MQHTKRVKILTVSDIHSSDALLGDLHDAVARHKPDVLGCIGDILDADGTDPGMIPPNECAGRIAALPVEHIVFVRGNHEHSNWTEFADCWRRSGRQLISLHGEAFVYGPLVIVGFPCLLGEEDAFRGPRPVLTDDPETWLRRLRKQFGNAMRSLWLMHEPPLGTRLSENSGVLSENREWMASIEQFAPRVVVFGHDHDTPHKKKLWNQRLPNGSTCINVGQSDRLRYSVIDLQFDRDTPCLFRSAFIRFGTRRLCLESNDNSRERFELSYSFGEF